MQIIQKILIVLALLAVSCEAGAQVLPKEGSMLNYRLIGFSFKQLAQPGRYIVEIATGNEGTEVSFKKNIIITDTVKDNKAIIKVPYFGKPYTWRYTEVAAGLKKTKSEFYHFTTMSIPDVDTNNTRVRITKNTGTYKDALIFLDGNRAIYDMNGQPLWYLPVINGLNNQSLRDVRDMKLSPQGTITFLLNNVPYEINYNGDVLWRGPNDGKVSGDSTEHYHHEFSRLRNGHYMVLGSEFVKWALPQSVDSNILRDGKIIYDSVSKSHYMKIEFGTVIEYDEKGNIVWSWRSSKYFRESDVQSKINGKLKSRDVHENSFFFDEKENVVYISFRNISRILKVHYPDGVVVNAYGDKFTAGGSETRNDLFCNQHSIKRSTDGNLYLFDNNFCNKGAAPKIVVMQETANDKNNLKKVWEYECPVYRDSSITHTPFVSGGNVIELPGNVLFVSLANDVYSNIFIVNNDKKILWSATPEKFDQVENKWESVYQYRASIVTAPDKMEQLILDAQNINRK